MALGEWLHLLSPLASAQGSAAALHRCQLQESSPRTFCLHLKIQLEPVQGFPAAQAKSLLSQEELGQGGDVFVPGISRGECIPVTIPTLPTTPLLGLLEQHPPQTWMLRPRRSICPFPAHTHPRKRPGSCENSHAREQEPHFHHWTCPQPGVAAAPADDKPALKPNLNIHNLLYQVLMPLMPPVLWPFSKISGTSSRLRIANFN